MTRAWPRTSAPAGTVGTIYVLHFSRPLAHARHYVGWTEEDPLARLERHLSGKGSPLVRAAVAAGIGVVLAKSWSGTRDDERAYKRGKCTPTRCPLCRMR